jgi:hypothetical protein
MSTSDEHKRQNLCQSNKKSDQQKVEIPRHEVVDILTIIKGFERKLQEKLKQA